MPAPYKQVYKLPNGIVITSIVMDQEEFNEFCDNLKGILHTDRLGGNMKRADDEQIEQIRASKHLPMMARGTKTQRFFDQYEVTTDYLCVIVRGTGGTVLAKLSGVNNG